LNRQVKVGKHIGSFFGLKVWYAIIPFVMFMIIYAIFRNNTTVVYNSKDIKISYISNDLIRADAGKNDVSILLYADDYLDEYNVPANGSIEINLIYGRNVLYMSNEYFKDEVEINVNKEE